MVGVVTGFMKGMGGRGRPAPVVGMIMGVFFGMHGALLGLG
jgi:hypothetical protein